MNVEEILARDKGGSPAMSSEYHSGQPEDETLPSGVDATTLGKVIHRIFEIGLMNPGPPSDIIPNLPSSWISKSPDRLTDDSLMKQVFHEILPLGADRDECSKIVRTILERIRKGPLGELCSGASADGHSVDGLRTEMPFHIARTVRPGGITRGDGLLTE